MSENTLENVEPSPEVEAPNGGTPAIVEGEPAIAEEEPTEEVSEKAVSDSVKEEVSAKEKKPRGRPKGPPKPKPEPKKRGRPPIESNPEPRPSYEAPATWDMAAYNQSLINALVAHSQSSKVQRRAQWSSLVKL